MRHMKTSDQTQAILFGKCCIRRNWPKSYRLRSQIITMFDLRISSNWIFRSKNQIWFVKIELNFLGQHLAAVKRASNQIITELTYKNFCNNLQVISLESPNWCHLFGKTNATYLEKLMRTLILIQSSRIRTKYVENCAMAWKGFKASCY